MKVARDGAGGVAGMKTKPGSSRKKWKDRDTRPQETAEEKNRAEWIEAIERNLERLFGI